MKYTRKFSQELKGFAILKLLMSVNSILDGILVTSAIFVNVLFSYWLYLDRIFLTKYLVLSLGLFMVLDETLGFKVSLAISDLAKLNLALKLTQEFLMEKSQLPIDKLPKEENMDEKIAIEISKLKFSYKNEFSDVDLDIQELAIKKG